VPKSAEVDAWFRDLDHPLKKAMLRVRAKAVQAWSRLKDR
jgi:hypothetical protein